MHDRDLRPVLRQNESPEGHHRGSDCRWQVNAGVIHPAQRPAAGTGESPHPLGGQLGDPLGAMDLAIHHHQNTVAAGFGAQRYLRRLKQIEWTIGTEGR